jgi:hypothetical protein
MPRARWCATIYYRGNAGLVDVEHEIEELEELAALVERGPHWDTVDRIEIRLTRPAQDAGLTVEQAEDL